MSSRQTSGRARTALLFGLVLPLLGLAPAAAHAAGPSISIANAANVTEGTGSPATASFTVSVTPASAVEQRVSYQTVNDTATAPGDFTAVNGTLVIPPNATTATIPITVVGDAIDEDDEQFQVRLLSVAADPPDQAGQIMNGTGVATILDDDAAPTVSVADTTKVEGTGTNLFMVYTISLSSGSQKPITLEYSTEAGTAVEPSTRPDGSSDPGDYTPRTGTLELTPGVTSRDVSITIIADAIDEANETFKLNVTSSNDNAVVTRGQGVGTIVDDDGPAISISGTTAVEGASGTTTQAVFPVTLSAPSPQDVSFAYTSQTTGSDTATTPADYVPTPVNATLTIPAGETTGSISVTINGDDLDEDDEKFRVVLTNPVNGVFGSSTGASTSSLTASGTITDDDATPTLTTQDVTVTEGTGGTTTANLPLRLSAASGRTILAVYATKDGTAVSSDPDGSQGGVDFQADSQLVTFNPGETTKTVAIRIAPDARIEEDESFDFYAFNAASGSNASDTKPNKVTIVDDDLTAANQPNASINDQTVREGNAGTTPMTFTVTLDKAPQRRTTIDYATSPGSASAPDDYDDVSGTLVFARGETSKTVDVQVKGDTTLEGNQDLRLVLSNAVNAGIADNIGLGTITDDDAGGGTISVLGSSVKASDVLCRPAPKPVKPKKGKKAKTPKAPACKGIGVTWSLAAPGTIATKVSAIYAPPKKAKKGKKQAKQTPPLTLVQDGITVSKAGPGSGTIKRAAGPDTTKLLGEVRKGKIKRFRVELYFENRFGAREALITKDLKLKQG